MKTILFLDTESTSLNNPHTVQLAMKEMDKPTGVYYHKPPCKIEFKAMAVHHITEEMVEDATPIVGEVRDRYNSYLEDKIVCCHNLDFDKAVLENDGIKFDEGICTLKVARRLYPEAEEYKLQYLRYFLGIRVIAEAHDAGGDVDVLALLFERMVADVKRWNMVKDFDEAVSLFQKLTLERTLHQTFPVGKYKGKLITEIIKTDNNYIQWFLNNSKGENDDLAYSIRHWLK